MCRGEQSESSASGMAIPDKEEAAYLGGESRHLSCPSNPGAWSSDMPQVDDVICLHRTADQGGTGEQYTGVEGMSCPGQRRPWRQGLTRPVVATVARTSDDDQGVT